MQTFLCCRCGATLTPASLIQVTFDGMMRAKVVMELCSCCCLEIEHHRADPLTWFRDRIRGNGKAPQPGPERAQSDFPAAPATLPLPGM